ncbi:MAG: hypothetical protein QOH50_1135 [Kribbellaceae bacterium]|jgi:hypothetical protein|nr:hypothetical protein [Kribbellaceae bacterium]
MMSPEQLPDEELPRQLDAAEEELASGLQRWFARATLLAGLVAGITLLLPWTFSRRLGLSVWQLGIENHPVLGLTWLVGLVASVVALVVRSALYPQIATTITGFVAVVYAAGSWQANAVDSSTDSWPGPGPAFAVVSGVIWLLCAAAQLIADQSRTSAPTDQQLQDAIDRLRRTRSRP